MDLPIIVKADSGWIEVVCGPMFSGKTEELIRRLKRARIAKQNVQIFKPAHDVRYSEDEVVSHDDNSLESEVVHSPSQIILLAAGADVIGIDEAQFFDVSIVEVCQELADQGKRVIVAGLDQDYMREPFLPISKIMSVAEFVTKLSAICVKCGGQAAHSQRLVSGKGRFLLGAREAYEPRCRGCFEMPKLPPKKKSRARKKKTKSNS